MLDLCSSWVSHFPRGLEELARKKKGGVGGGVGGGKGEESGEGPEGLEVLGLGMNAAELHANPILSRTILQNLNQDPEIPTRLAPLDATVCVVSIDYLTRPIAVLSSLLQRTKEGGSVHLVVSNRCFPTKAVGRWLRIGEEERLQMVGDFLWEGGWRGVEVLVLSDGKAGGGGGWFGAGRVDPLWVVRGVKER